MYWLSNSIIHDYYQKRAADAASVHWINFIAQEYVSEGSSVLSMGCGEGALERHLTLLRSNLRIKAIDFSNERIQTAIDNASKVKNATLLYECVDFFAFLSRRTEEKYDCVIFNMSLHHAADPYKLLSDVKSILSPRGRVILNEYIGPARLQATSKTRSLIEHFLGYQEKNHNGSTRKEYIYPRVIDVVAADPSEAINPTIIEAAANELFRVIYRKPIATGFLPNITEFYADMSSALADQVCYLDGLYLDFSILEAEYVLYVLELSES